VFYCQVAFGRNPFSRGARCSDFADGFGGH
jgi:hypothetical protein